MRIKSTPPRRPQPVSTQPPQSQPRISVVAKNVFCSQQGPSNKGSTESMANDRSKTSPQSTPTTPVRDALQHQDPDNATNPNRGDFASSKSTSRPAPIANTKVEPPSINISDASSPIRECIITLLKFDQKARFLDQQLKGTTEEMSRLDSKYRDIHEKCRTLDRTNRGLEDSLRATKVERDNLKTAVHNHEAKHNSLETEYNRYKRKCAEALSCEQTYRQERNEIQAKYNKLYADHSTLRETYDKKHEIWKVSSSKLENDLVDTKTKHESAQARALDLQSQLVDFRDRLTRQENNNAALKSQLSRTQQVTEGIRKLLDTSQARLQPPARSCSPPLRQSLLDIENGTTTSDADPVTDSTIIVYQPDNHERTIVAKPPTSTPTTQNLNSSTTTNTPSTTTRGSSATEVVGGSKRRSRDREEPAKPPSKIPDDRHTSDDEPLSKRTRRDVRSTV